MTLTDAINEWTSKRRKMGCVSATEFLCNRVDGFTPLRQTHYLPNGETYEHVVATNGSITVDLVPHLNSPEE